MSNKSDEKQRSSDFLLFLPEQSLKYKMRSQMRKQGYQCFQTSFQIN